LPATKSVSATQNMPIATEEPKPIAADLAAVRRGIEQLATQQQQLAAQQQQFTAQQQQIAAQQERITQSVVALQALEEEIRQKVSSSPPPRPVTVPARAAQSPAAQPSRGSSQPRAGQPLPLVPQTPPR